MNIQTGHMPANRQNGLPASEMIAEANHRIANSLTLLVGLVRLQANALGKVEAPLSPAEVRLMLEGIAARISTIGQLHRLLAHMPPAGLVDLGAHLREVCNAMVTALSSAEQPVCVDFAESDCMVLTGQVQPLTLILCEIIINALKYAHPAGVPVRISIGCHATSDGHLMIEACDDGVGLPEGFDTATGGGLGFRVIRSLAKDLGAMLDIETGDLGLCFRLTLPAGIVANALTA